MATVYLARTRRAGIERDVALKLTHAHLRDTPEFATELLEEAKIAVRIRHPNVVPVLDVDDDPQGVFLVMQYVEGDTLGGLRRKATIESKPIPRPVSMRILLDALAGLHAAHELRDEEGALMGVVHRDFSPQNILVGVDGIAKLTDFGIAKATSRHGHTRTGLVKGKISYMAPEQARGMSLDRRCDVWAAGVIAWEMLAQRRLYVADNDVGTLLKVVTEAPLPLSRVATAISDELEEAVAHALTIDLDSRVGSALAFAKELESACQSAGYLADHEEVAAYVGSLVGPHLAERRARATEVVRLRGNLADVIGPAIADRSRDSVDSVSSSQVLGFAEAMQSEAFAIPRHLDDDDDDSGEMATIVREPEFESDEMPAPPVAPIAAESASALLVAGDSNRPGPPPAPPPSNPSMNTGEMETRLREFPHSFIDDEDDLAAKVAARRGSGVDEDEEDDASDLAQTELRSFRPDEVSASRPSWTPEAKPALADRVGAKQAPPPSMRHPLELVPSLRHAVELAPARADAPPLSGPASSAYGPPLPASARSAPASPQPSAGGAVRAPTDPVAPAPFAANELTRPTEPSLDLETQVHAPAPNSVACASVVTDVGGGDPSTASDDGILVRLDGGLRAGPTVRVNRAPRRSRMPWVAGGLAAVVCAAVMSWWVHPFARPEPRSAAATPGGSPPRATAAVPSAPTSESVQAAESAASAASALPSESKALAFHSNAPIAAVRIDGRESQVQSATKDLSIALLPEETSRTLKLALTSADGRQTTALVPAGAASVRVDFPPPRPAPGRAPAPRPAPKEAPVLAPSPYSR